MKISIEPAPDAGMSIVITPACDHEKALLDRIQADHSIVPAVSACLEELRARSVGS